jgi:hypothetical protein
MSGPGYWKRVHFPEFMPFWTGKKKKKTRKRWPRAALSPGKALFMADFRLVF